MKALNTPELISEYNLKGFDLSIDLEIKSGKEAAVYKVTSTDQAGNVTIYALKVYFETTGNSFNRYNDYIEGNRISRTYKIAVARKNKTGRKFIEESRIQREYNMLLKFSQKSENIPKPIAFGINSILMEYIGDTSPAPRLTEVSFDTDEAKLIFDDITKNIDLFLELGIVHADLSPFNILYWQDKPYIIDFPQAVDIKTNPHFKKMLTRDLDNITKYFSKFIEIDKEALYSRYDKYLKAVTPERDQNF